MAKYNDLTVGQMEAAINKMGGWEAFQAYLRGEFVMTKVTQASTILRLVAGSDTLTIGPRDGRRTIAKARKTFKSHIDFAYTNWDLDKPSAPTSETKVQVHEMIKDADFNTMFASLSRDLNVLCFTQDQIIEFCEKHPNWLRTEGYATLFLFRENGEFFVASVLVNSYFLRVYVHRLGHGRVWYADDRLRLVSPQLAA